MNLRRLAPAVQRRLRRLRAGLVHSGGMAARARPVGVANTDRNSDAVLRWNLDQVIAALASGGVDHFVVPSPPGDLPRVGVHAQDRQRVFAALRSHRAWPPLYLKVPGTARARADAADPRYLADATTFKVFTYHDAGALRMGPEYGCEVELWTRTDDAFAGPRPNPRSTKVPEIFTGRASIEVLSRPYPSWEAFDVPDHVDVPRFPVDLVYTWVDGSDAQWQERQADARGAADGIEWHAAAAGPGRYQQRDELRYSLRSAWMYADFFRKIYIVTDRQVPSWLDVDNERVQIVDHTEILSGVAALPTFNSHAIESRLHHIDGLSEHFVYANDDMFIGRRITPEAFYCSNGITKFITARPLDEGPPSPADNPAEVAAKNNRAALRQRWPDLVMHKVRHAPYPLRRSILLEMEKEYAEGFAATASHQFRHPDDHSVPSSFFHYYAYATSRAVPVDLPFVYVDISRMPTDRLARTLRRIRRTRPTLYCVNDVMGDVSPQTESVVRDFLDAMYPIASPFER